ncbi:hypothetical protein VTI74DRAFT_7133 [Chaetomium olivicolor]
MANNEIGRVAMDTQSALAGQLCRSRRSQSPYRSGLCRVSLPAHNRLIPQPALIFSAVRLRRPPTHPPNELCYPTCCLCAHGRISAVFSGHAGITHHLRNFPGICFW